MEKKEKKRKKKEKEKENKKDTFIPKCYQGMYQSKMDTEIRA